MSCYYPRKAYAVETGITFQKPEWHSGAYLKIPCKRCVGCRLDHRTNWANRMLHEASENSLNNQFVTFTYGDENLPPNGDLCQEDMQKFFKRLRKEFKTSKIRYVYSGEYGEQKSRPHYHAIIFGLDVPDLKEKGRNERGEPLYGSAILDRIWSLGETTTGAVTRQSCAYVAGYMLKDINGNYNATDRDGKTVPYYAVDSDGVMHQRKRPFARFSNRPAIGRKWFEKYLSDCFPQDYLIMDGGKQFAVPSYYFDLLKKINPKMHAAVLAKRETFIDQPDFKKNNTRDRLRVREIVKKAEINVHKRGSEKSQGNHVFLKVPA